MIGLKALYFDEMKRKEELRETIRARLKSVSEEDIAWKSYLICDHVQKQPEWQNARIVGLFASLPTEPVVEFLWDNIRATAKKVCYPKVNGENLSLILVNDPSELVISRWQLREPTPREPTLLSPDKIDVILVPGLAFSLAGERLGRGGGFYDRLFARDIMRAYKIGVCFEMQSFPELPMESHDITLDAVITENGAFRRVAQRTVAPRDPV